MDFKLAKGLAEARDLADIPHVKFGVCGQLLIVGAARRFCRVCIQ